MHAEVVGGLDDGNSPENVPSNLASVWLDYTFQDNSALDGFGVGGGIRYVGQRYGAAGNRYDLGGVGLLDASIHYRRDKLTASVNFQNLTDKDYVANCGDFGCYYGDGPSVIARLTVNW
jgi:iron complex outermembrane receptor protein